MSSDSVSVLLVGVSFVGVALVGVVLVGVALGDFDDVLLVLVVVVLHCDGPLFNNTLRYTYMYMYEGRERGKR